MSTTGLDVFDTTVQQTNEWLNSVSQKLGQDDKRLAYHALRATLQTLRDRMLVVNSVEFGAQLPMLVRGFYFEGWNPSHNPVKDRNKEDFLAHVGEKYHEKDVDLETLVKAVFTTVNEKMTPGQVMQTREMLNLELRDLWPEPAPA